MEHTRQSLRTLFEAALRMPADARTAFLVERCPDLEQRAKIEHMLEADHSEDDPALAVSADALARAIGDSAITDTLPPGSRIGPFELIEVLGEGGSSTVFRAARDFEGVRQQVALKLLRRGMYSPDAQRQFRRERIALGQLSHPHIASLIEGGVTESGLAYIALELVEGKPITDYARDQRLTLRRRLDLFLHVCRAVEAAHRALIVHRDLKPSNVLVSNDGHVKLLDFGIAKLLDSDDTQTRLPSFTPAYAAPEQMANGPITTATDVYALGILLGELITGQRLNDGSGRTPSTRVRMDSDPGALPATPRVVRRLLRGDLDNILLKALNDEPERRYVSAGALADDIERFLVGQPVAAHPPTRWYRASKFVRRHRGGVALTAGFLLAILAALGLALWQAKVARDEAARANAMRAFMFSAFAEAEPSVPRAGPPSVADVVEAAIARIRSDSTMHTPTRIELRTRLGEVLTRQGRLESAGTVLQQNYDQAVQLLGADAALTLDAGSELMWNWVLSGNFQKARVFADDLLARTPPHATALRTRLLMKSATLATKQRDRQRALSEGRQAVDLARALNDADAMREALSDFGNVQLTLDDVPGAIATYEEVLANEQRKFGAAHLDVAKTHAALSRAYRRSGDLVAAERHARAALAIDAAVLSKDDWRHAEHLNALMMVQLQQRDYRAVRDTATEELRINRIALGDEHPETGNDLNSVGMANALLEDYAAATPLLLESLSRVQAKFGPDHYETAITRANYGFVRAKSGDVAGGEAELRRAIATFDALAEREPEEQAATIEKLVRLKLDAHNAKAALPLIDRIDSLIAKSGEPDAYWDGRAAMLRAAALLELDNPAQAQPLLDASSAAIAHSGRPDPVLQVEVPLLQAQTAAKLGDDEGAGRLAAKGFDLLAALRNPPSRLLQLAARLRASGIQASTP